MIEVLGVLGLFISLYFTGVYYGYIMPNHALLPKDVCSRGSCSGVLFTPYARIFYLPNFVFGIGYYLVVLSYSLFSDWMTDVFFLLSWFVAFFSIYLAFTLLFRLRTACILCFIAQAINILIAVLFTIFKYNIFL